MYLRLKKHLFGLKKFCFSGTVRPAVLLALAAAGAAAAGCGLIPGWCYLPLLAAGIFLRPRYLAVYLAGIAAVTLSVWLHGDLFTMGQENIFLPEKRRATLKLQINDRRLNSIPEIPPPSLIRAAILQCHPAENMPDEGQCFLRLHGRSKIPEYGSVISADVLLTMPHQPYRLCRNGRSSGKLTELNSGFKRYLAARDCDTIAIADNFEVLQQKRDIFSLPLKLRDILLARTIANMNSDANRQLCAALFFGASGGLEPSLRRDFAASGTVHLFAVSGLHVGMLAALTALLLAPLPFKIRHILIAVTVWSYVFLTGVNPPAVRAGLMISAVCFFRGFLFQIPLTDLLGAAAALLLMSEPALVGDTGFQYSFIITAAMLLWSERHREIITTVRSEEALIPDYPGRRAFRRKQSRLERTGGALAATATAFLAGAGISIINQDLFLPGAIVANLLMMPLLPFFFIILFFKLSFGTLFTVCDRFGGEALDLAFDTIRGLAEIFAEIFVNIPVCRPSAAEVIIYTSGILLFLALRRSPTAALASGTVSLLILLSLIVRVQLRPPLLLAVSGDTGTPAAIALAVPASGEAAVINLPGYSESRLLVDALTGHGIRKITHLTFDAPYSNRAAGIAAANHKLKPQLIQLPPETGRRNRSFAEKIESRLFREDTIQMGSGNPAVKILQTGGSRGFTAAIKLPEAAQLTVSTENQDDGRMITISGRNGSSRRFLLPWSRELNLLEVPLDR